MYYLPYLSTMSAEHIKFNRSVSCPNIIFAVSEDEALGKSIKAALERWPVETGWVHHNSNIPSLIDETTIEFMYHTVQTKKHVESKNQ